MDENIAGKAYSIETAVDLDEELYKSLRVEDIFDFNGFLSYTERMPHYKKVSMKCFIDLNELKKHYKILRMRLAFFFGSIFLMIMYAIYNLLFQM